MEVNLGRGGLRLELNFDLPNVYATNLGKVLEKLWLAMMIS